MNSKHPPNNKLNYLVAQKLMGWEMIKHDHPAYRPPMPGFIGEIWHIPEAAFPANTRLLGDCPDFSGYMMYAWAIAEQHKKDWSTTVSVEDGKFYHCYINSNSEGHYDRNGEWPRRLGSAISTHSAAHAICIAALVAVGAIEQEKY